MDGLPKAETSKEGDGSADKPRRRQGKSADEVFTGRQFHSYQQEVCKEVLRKLRESDCEAVHLPGFEDDIIAHFTRLPTRYALDVNTDRAEDVLLHQKLLQLAEIPENRPVFHVRAVCVLPSESLMDKELSTTHTIIHNQKPIVDSEGNLDLTYLQDYSVYAPAFGKLDSLSLEQLTDGVDIQRLSSRLSGGHYPVHEVTFSTIDKTKLLSQLSSLLADVGLNIREAHVFSTTDGFSLDVFIVHGWHVEDTEDLEQALRNALSLIGKEAWKRASPSSSPIDYLSKNRDSPVALCARLSEVGDDWELDSNLLKLEHKVASGSFGDLYKGTYCGQDVAIKLLKHENFSSQIEREFSQEVFIMRKVRHKNVVQFIGACTKASRFCIVTEFMAGGSLYDYLHRQNRVFKSPMLLRVALDIAKGMDYLHQNNIIHRDLKAANLLLDENEVVKVADFGVARFQSQSGAMTAETGTYRWMAPEVISHLPYGHKADIFSFGIVLWELLTGKLPYESMNPVQAAIGVRQGLRPQIPEQTPPELSDLIKRCWHDNPSERPDFCEISSVLQILLLKVHV
ncbi:hypothetical protein GOP47_0014277 [Adiantum capillus-veneris]|uniref:non-specific serine/threonine protein kinase n=1 Tax=Adiantum capillus-veneris TaxID=13818 RepID=A0A9D4UL70_ADICA|nr:hypothetical protein GOP47_0014277 [Adiantum capillus-veneris]